MGKSKSVYVAETDESGQVIWVWRSGPHERAAHPIRNPGRHLARLEGARFSGAPPAAIIDWLRTKAAAETVS